ncbi:MAG: DegT/DnrJ/EryC1/StrS family aminotransferase, partial [Phycisphaerae bacterium]|nr:DegT/DnrJ/EryC1/StrS family aminotransferase [Phycisphaerae bacterium]
MERIPISGPWITQKEIDYVTDAVTNAWYSNANMYHARFEKAFADYLDVRYAISLPSCTSAIHLSLATLGIGPGDEVIVPEITWIASAAPVSYVGATTVFADVDPASWCLSADSFGECITPKTKAVIPVDIYGNMPDMDAILDVAKRHGVSVIEDAAQAIGAEYKAKKAGSFGVSGTFSFHGSKTMTTGEGGMLVTDCEDLFKRAMVLRDHGRPPGDTMFCNTDVAFKYKMSSMQAALGLAQIERIDELIDRKRQIFSWYREGLKDVEGVTLNAEAEDVKNTYWMVSVIIDSEMGLEKERLMRLLAENYIDSRPFFRP